MKWNIEENSIKEWEEFWIIFNGFIVLEVIALTKIVGDVCERNVKFLEVWPF